MNPTLTPENYDIEELLALVNRLRRRVKELEAELELLRANVLR